MEPKYCDKYVCLSVYSHNSKTTRPNFTFLCTSPVAVTRSSSDGVAMLCTSGLRMTSSFYIMALWRVVCIPKQQQKTTSITAEIPTKFCSTIKTRSTHHELCKREGAKFTIYDFRVFKTRISRLFGIYCRRVLEFCRQDSGTSMT